MADERNSVAQRMESIGQLTGGLAHDFNNLLAIIMGNLDMVIMDPQDKQTGHRVQLALNAAERGAELVKSLLALAAKQQLQPAQVDLVQLLARMAPLLRHALGPSVQFALESLDTPVLALLDVAGLEAALLNLAINARAAMPEGGQASLSLRLHRPSWPRTHSSPLLAVVALRDNGTGMTEAVRRKATEPFYTTKPRGHGTGLGLSMVAGFVQQSGGEMRIDSSPGQGTLVEIYVPVVAQAALPAPAPASRAVPSASGVVLVLVLDDEQAVATLMCDWAREAGFTVLPASTVKEALTLLASRPVDLLVSDIVMPGPLDGFALADLVAEVYPATKILLVSGYSRDSAHGRTDLPWPMLVKPFKMAEFQAALQLSLQPVAPAPEPDWAI